jgi:ribosomal protein S18 acetylase RimI-like enzyme
MTDSSFRIRRARPEDAEALVVMIDALAAVVKDPPTGLKSSDIRRDGFGADPWFVALLAEGQGDAPLGLLGYALASRSYSTDRKGRGWYLADLYVRGERRSGGIGRALMAEAARLCREDGGRWLAWDVWVENEQAFHFYEGIGARRAGELEVMLIEGEALAGLAAERQKT